MLRIGYRAHDLGSFESASELGRRLEEIRSTSFIQLALKKVIPSSKPWQEWDEEYISSIASELKSHGVSIAIVGCYINPIHPADKGLRMPLCSNRDRFAASGSEILYKYFQSEEHRDIQG